MLAPPPPTRPGRAFPYRSRVVSELAQQVVDGDRRALARAITLVESTRADHRAEAEALLAELLPHTGGAIRVGISGAPGAGKSTFIEALGLPSRRRTATGSRCSPSIRRAHAAADRSSATRRAWSSSPARRTRSCGRRRRAARSAASPGARARRCCCARPPASTSCSSRPSASGSPRSRSPAMVDLFLVLVAPGGGDELQGLKRGIMELADLVVVNKADGDLARGRAAHRGRLLRRAAPRAAPDPGVDARGCCSAPPSPAPASTTCGRTIGEFRVDGRRHPARRCEPSRTGTGCGPS